jgi:predicted naringenin-chalcone synthase
MRFAQTAGVDNRSLALPLSRYPKLSGFTESNDAYLEVAVDLDEQAIRKALAEANIEPHEVDTIVMVSSAGIAVPTIDAVDVANRAAAQHQACPVVRARMRRGRGGYGTRLRLPARLPGPVGCAAVGRALLGHAAARRHLDPGPYRRFPLGDGAAAVVVAGANRITLGPNAYNGPRILATHSRVVSGTVDVMGWNVSASGFQLVMSRDVPKITDDYLCEEVDGFLADHGLSIADISTWVCHPGGPKVLESVKNTLGLPPQALAHSRNSMRENGNMSSVSVLDVLRRTVAEPPRAGAFGVMLAMGPGFSFELLLLQW